jgi:hypothetical protein
LRFASALAIGKRTPDTRHGGLLQGDEVDMIDQPSDCPVVPRRPIPFLAAIVLTTGIFACSIYANLSFAVTNTANYRYFPPFQPFVNQNMNNHLGAEYFHIARALVAGEGFANPFGEPTGPTAWMPPVLPAVLAGLLWLCDGNKDAVMAIVVFLQVYVLVGTGLLVLVLVRQTTERLGAAVAAAIFFVGLLSYFHLCFQFTHDCWLILLAMDVLIAGFCWWQPLQRWPRAAGWGLVGGLCALINPVVAFTWGMFSLLIAWRQRAWSRLALASVVAGLTLAPWIVRNYLLFGRLIPVKSNLAYELFQSQCLQPDGLLRSTTFGGHPYASAGRERQEYKGLGEIAFLERRKEIFLQAVAADPVDFLDRVASRFLGATLWYVPFDRTGEIRRPWVLWSNRLTHPLPFLALLLLVFTAAQRPLHGAQWAVIAIYLLYLLPYIGVSYYERYAMPLLGVKALLVIWAADRLLSWLPRHSREIDRDSSPPAARTGRQSRAVSMSQ